jgi:hypothetical protein
LQTIALPSIVDRNDATVVVWMMALLDQHHKMDEKRG